MRIVLLILGAVALAALGYFLYTRRARLGETFKLDIGNAAPKAAGGSDTSTEKGFHNRLVGLGIFSGSILGILAARLVSMQLISSNDYEEQAESNRTRTVTTAAPRGRILDRNGVELVTNRPCLAVAADPEVVEIGRAHV